MRVILNPVKAIDPSGRVIAAVTANARYIHTSFALRCLAANLSPFAADIKLLEFTLEDSPLEIAEKILELNPAAVWASISGIPTCLQRPRRFFAAFVLIFAS
jgi:hypothetical protein